jgi:5-methylcytosine-specific restriction endonuclease McrA
VTINPDGQYQCQHCAVRFDWTRAKPGRPPQFCSRECANAPKPTPCAVCGEVVLKDTTKGASRRSVCSTMCRYFVQYGRWQSQPWTPPVSKRRIAAARKLAAAEAGLRGSTWYAGPCRTCGSPFVFNQPNSAACSEKCAAKYHRDLRRARKSGAYVAPVYRAKVYQRDRWTCQLCGKKVKRNAVVPHPLAPTIDHVIPLAAGGTHEPANCQTAHFICNARKSAAGGGEQLALIG